MPLLKNCFLFCVLILFSATASADTLRLRNLDHRLSLGKHLSLLQDRFGSLTIHQVMQRDSQFVPVTTDVPVFAHRDGWVWTKLVLVNETGLPLWLHVDNPTTDTVLFYERSAQGFVAKLSGDKVDFNHRDIESNKILFQLTNTNAPLTIYMRLNIRLPRQFPLYLTNAEVLGGSGTINVFANGFFYGLIIVILLYNIFLWIILRHRFYFYYIAYVFSYTILLLYFDGIAYTWLWRDQMAINDHPAIFAALPTFFALGFVSSFLNLGKHNIIMRRGLWCFAVLLLGCSILSLAGEKFLALTLSHGMTFIAAVYFLVPGFIAWRSGYKPARYYLVAWSFLISTVLFFLAKDFAWIPYSWFTAHSLKIGLALEAAMIGFALVDRIRFYKKDRRRLRNEKEREIVQRIRAEEELKAAAQLLDAYTLSFRQRQMMLDQIEQGGYEERIGDSPEQLAHLEELRQSIILTDEDWTKFRSLFDKVHAGYIYRLREKYANLSETDIRLLTLMKLRLSTHEMANMLGVGMEAIRKSKQRLRKKLQMEPEGNLEELIAAV